MSANKVCASVCSDQQLSGWGKKSRTKRESDTRSGFANASSGQTRRRFSLGRYGHCVSLQPGGCCSMQYCFTSGGIHFSA